MFVKYSPFGIIGIPNSLKVRRLSTTTELAFTVYPNNGSHNVLFLHGIMGICSSIILRV